MKLPRFPHLLVLLPLALLVACSSSKESPAPSPTPSPAPPVEYGVPYTGDIEFTARAALGAITYHDLDAEQRAAWAEVWEAACEGDTVPLQEYVSDEPPPLPRGRNIFLWSAIDGYVVAYAHHSLDRLTHAGCLAFLEALAATE